MARKKHHMKHDIHKHSNTAKKNKKILSLISSTCKATSNYILMTKVEVCTIFYTMVFQQKKKNRLNHMAPYQIRAIDSATKKTCTENTIFIHIKTSAEKCKSLNST